MSNTVMKYDVKSSVLKNNKQCWRRKAERGKRRKAERQKEEREERQKGRKRKANKGRRRRKTEDN